MSLHSHTHTHSAVSASGDVPPASLGAGRVGQSQSQSALVSNLTDRPIQLRAKDDTNMVKQNNSKIVTGQGKIGNVAYISIPIYMELFI